jgi:hypothetical protein
MASAMSPHTLVEATTFTPLAAAEEPLAEVLLPQAATDSRTIDATATAPVRIVLQPIGNSSSWE